MWQRCWRRERRRRREIKEIQEIRGAKGVLGKKEERRKNPVVTEEWQRGFGLS
jgi:hypothetical protein